MPAPCPASTPRRTGSRTVSISRAISTPGRPTLKSTTCQGRTAPMKRQADGTGLTDRLYHQATDQKGQARTEECSGLIDTDRTAEFLAREIVGDHRIGSRRKRRLAHAHTDARQKQFPEIACQTADCSHHAPQENSPADDRATAVAVSEPADRQSDRRIEHGKGQPLQHAELGIA